MTENRSIHLDLADEAATVGLGRAIADSLRGGEVIGLIGTLGAGKTRLSRAIAEALGVDPSAISSPTFTLIHEYVGKLSVHHFDTYRLRSVEEFDDLDPAEYWSRGDGVCLIEWADRVLDRLPADSWRIRIEAGEGTERRVELTLPDAATLERVEAAIARDSASLRRVREVESNDR
ncbi:MAG: tRNA (adenosine(37)-N6)-threonylcarbamoyltransferase complex ATPase subunit type 1 TsaE [Isosphaeraceae bacterium]|nr:tRNA (adenosine(37)-N6)-threonylcarbamoyltransferase complex ATPase subunit type 1 TsaE [Isosphaeraceae bacterium]